MGWNLAIAIVEPSGDLIYFRKMAGAPCAGGKIAIGKARSAAIFHLPAKVFFDGIESGQPYRMSLFPGLVAADGAVPIIENGKIIGAIGVTGVLVR